MGDEVEIKVTADNEASDELQKVRGDLAEVGSSADKAIPKIKGVGDAFDTIGDAARRSSRSSQDHAGRLDAVGEKADETEGKFTGLASGIDGVTTLMDDPSPQEFAQGLADMADGAGNFLVPALKSAGTAISNVAQKLTGATTGLQAVTRGAALAAGAAGIGALLFAIHEIGEARLEAKIQDLADDFIATGESATIAAAAADLNVTTFGELGKTFTKLLETNPVLAEDFVSLAESAGVSKDVTSAMRDELEKAAATEKGLAKATEDARTELEIQTDAINIYNAAVDKMLGKTFGLSEAQANLTLAIHDASEAVKANREENAETATSLDINTEAGARNVLMLESLVRAEADVIQALKEGGATESEVSMEIRNGSRAIEDQAVKMGFNRSQVQLLTGALLNIPQRVTADIGIRGREQSIRDIHEIQTAINELRGRDVGIRIVGTSVGVAIPGGGLRASGGVTGAAAGGPRGGLFLVGEQGPELAELPFGSRVHSNPDTERMMAGGGQVTHVHNYYIAGSIWSERELVGKIADERNRAGFFAGVS